MRTARGTGPMPGPGTNVPDSANRLIPEAQQFATQAHRRIPHPRRHPAQEYRSHLKAVAELVAAVTDDPELIAAAWLHEVIEDTPATHDDVQRRFGTSVASLVEQLTNVSRPSDGNRASRAALDRAHIAEASTGAKTVKLADLIVSCREVFRHAPRAGHAFLNEMAASLEVLRGGDERLFRKAELLLAENSARLGLGAVTPAAADLDEDWHSIDPEFTARHDRTLRTFARTFRADDIAEPLPSFDHNSSAETAQATMASAGIAVAGVRRGGVISGYLRLSDPADGTCGEAAVRFSHRQIVEGDASLSDVVEVITRHDYCFITLLGQVAGVIRRDDMQKPVARMWLFGIITLLEMTFTDRISELWPDGSWEKLLSPKRLDMARTLQKERRRREQHCTLLDCLQLADKARILLQNPTQLAKLGFDSRNAAQRAIKDLESLRNNLAHGQDIVTHDWPQIVRFARRLEILAATLSRR